MAVIYCDQGCGNPYALELGFPDEPVHQFLCPVHAVAWFVEFMNTVEGAQLAAAGVEQGSPEDFAEQQGGRSRRRGARPRVVAVDNPLRAVVEQPEETPEAPAGEEGA
jgi:hypothetical protein